MPFTKLFGLTGLAKPLTSEEGRRILERDQYRCQYCGLDELAVMLAGWLGQMPGVLHRDGNEETGLWCAAEAR